MFRPAHCLCTHTSITLFPLLQLIQRNDVVGYRLAVIVMDIVVRRYLPNDLRRASHGDDVRRNVLRDDGGRADDRIVPDMRPRQNSDVGRDPHVAAQMDVMPAPHRVIRCLDIRTIADFRKQAAQYYLLCRLRFSGE